MVRLVKNKKDSSAFFEWCDEVEAVNDLNFCALWRQMLKMPSFRSLENASLTAGAARMCQRLELKPIVAAKWPLIELQLDRAAHRILLSYKSQRKTNRSWFENNRDWLGLLMPLRSAAAALEEKQNFINVQKDIEIVAQSCETGRVLLAKVMREMNVNKGVVAVNDAMEQLQKAGKISAGVLARHKAAFLARAKEDGVDPELPWPKPKMVAMQYRGKRIEVEATSCIDHYKHAEALCCS